MLQCLKSVYYSTCLYFFCFIVSAFLIFELPSIFKTQVDNGIDDEIQLDSPKAGGFKQFEDHNKDGINTFHIYFFNITNPDGILNGDLPKVDEIGPFIYLDDQLRSDIQIDKKKDEVTFRLHSESTFLPVETLEACGHETDLVPITTFNMIFFGAEPAMGETAWHMAFNAYPDRDKMFMTRPARDILYGYNETKGGLTVAYPGVMPNLNLTDDPDYTNIHIISAGLDDETNYNYKTWRGQTHVKVQCPWGIQGCPDGNFPCCILESPVWQHRLLDLKDKNPNKVGGSTGDQFKPSTPDEVSVWLDILQRELKLKYQKSVKYKGVKCKRYIIDSVEKMNDIEYPVNWQFYQYGRNGLFNMSMLLQGLPIFASYPHFYDSDANLSARVIGMNPQQDLHETSLDVEYHTGTTLRERKRFQINMQIKPRAFRVGSGWFSNLAHADEGQFVPILWLDQQGDTKDSDMGDLKKMDEVIAAESWVRYVGIALVSISLIVWIFVNWRQPSEDPRLNSSHAGLNFFGSGNAGTDRLVVDSGGGAACTTEQSDYPVGTYSKY